MGTADLHVYKNCLFQSTVEGAFKYSKACPVKNGSSSNDYNFLTIWMKKKAEKSLKAGNKRSFYNTIFLLTKFKRKMQLVMQLRT